MQAFPYIHWRSVPFGATDAAAIVYTPRFSEYCMEAAEAWFRDYVGVDWYRANTEGGMGTPVVRMEMSFRDSLVANDQFGVVVRVARVGRSTVHLGLEGIRRRGDAPRAVSILDGAYVFCFTRKNKGAVPIPAEHRRRLDTYVERCAAEDATQARTE